MARIQTLLLGLIAGAVLGALPAPSQAASKPSVVVIMTDDQTYEDMAAMPLTRRLIGGSGATFTRSYVSYPLCCPSRATFLTGQYAHNHGVRSTTPPTGGVEALKADETLAVWLQRAGYHTAHVGKYLNGYGLRRKPRVPPGWDDWRATVDKSTYQMWGYTLHENGVDNTYGDFLFEDPQLYQTDVLGQKAIEAVQAAGDEPLFLALNFVAPHGEVDSPGSATSPFIRAAPRHLSYFFDAGLPRTFLDEADVSDKPIHLRRLPRLREWTLDRIHEDFRARRESLLSVDEAVAKLMAELQRTGRLDNTYVIFTSDNGFMQGEHRIPKGKYFAYDASAHVPLMIRGPGIAPGTVSGELVGNIDLAPTILAATGATAGVKTDGWSLLPFAGNGALRSRRPVLHEGLVGGDADRDGAPRNGSLLGTYFGIRTERYLYVMWRGGGRELYDLARDPHELHSVHNDRRYARVRRVLEGELRRLRRCAGQDCLTPLPRVGGPRR